MITHPPLNFLGNKKKFRNILFDIFKKYSKEYIFVDLFGGSGYLSYIAKYSCKDNKVIYNDFDHYSERLLHVEETQKILDEIGKIINDAGIDSKKEIDKKTADDIKRLLQEKEQHGEFIDWITMSSQLCFSMNIKQTSEDFNHAKLYNKINKKSLKANNDYLNGIDIVHKDWKELYNEYKDKDNIVYLIDPPYPNTLTEQYKNDICFDDTLLLLDIFHSNNNVYYFTSSKSNIIELYKWKYDDDDVTITSNVNGTGYYKEYRDYCMYKNNI